MHGMAMQFTVTLPDELGRRLHAAADGNISQWISEAVQDRLDREMWEKFKTLDRMLEITEEWMYRQVRLRDGIRGEAR